MKYGCGIVVWKLVLIKFIIHKYWSQFSRTHPSGWKINQPGMLHFASGDSLTQHRQESRLSSMGTESHTQLPQPPAASPLLSDNSRSPSQGKSEILPPHMKPSERLCQGWPSRPQSKGTESPPSLMQCSETTMQKDPHEIQTHYMYTDYLFLCI